MDISLNCWEVWLKAYLENVVSPMISTGIPHPQLSLALVKGVLFVQLQLPHIPLATSPDFSLPMS